MATNGTPSPLARTLAGIAVGAVAAFTVRRAIRAVGLQGLAIVPLLMAGAAAYAHEQYDAPVAGHLSSLGL